MYRNGGLTFCIYLSLIIFNFNCFCSMRKSKRLSGSKSYVWTIGATLKHAFVSKSEPESSIGELGSFVGTGKIENRLDSLLPDTSGSVKEDVSTEEDLVNATWHLVKYTKRLVKRSFYDSLLPPIDTSTYFADVDMMDFETFVRFWEKSVCGDKCLDVTDNIITDVTMFSADSCDGCFCDGCSVYGDCCLDKVLEGETLNNSLLQYTSCTSPTQGFRDGGSEGSYILVTKCPVDYNDDIVRRNCENLPNKFETILNNPPVYSHKSQMNYLNSHCADCHNDFDNLTEWTSQITCRKPVKLSNIKTMDDLIILINTDVCSMFYPPKDSLSRLCQVNVSDIISECNMTGDWIGFNRDLEKACDMYVNSVTVNSTKFHNVFCALCNGKRSEVIDNWESIYNAGEEYPEFVPPFSIIFNLRPRSEHPETLDDSKCPEDAVFLPDGSCRKLVCSPGRILVHRRCEYAFKTARGLGFTLRYGLLTNQQPIVLGKSDITELWTTYLSHLLGSYDSSLSTLEAWRFEVRVKVCYKPAFEKNMFTIENVTIDIKLVIGADISQRLAELPLLRLFESEWEFNNSVWKVEAVVPNEMTRPDPEFECRTFSSYRPKGPGGDLLDEYLLNDDLFIPLTPMSLCNQTELLPEEYSLNHTTGLLNTNVTGMEYKVGEYTIGGDRVRICFNVSCHETHTVSQKYQMFQKNMQLVTAVSMGVSIFCLFLTIAICIVSKTRHTAPGKITIALVSTLIIAQLLFITSGQASRNRWGCRFVGLALHYFWLAVFGWQQVAGYHMYVSFVHPFRKSFSNGITFVKYMSFAFGVPLVIVVCYTITHVIISNKNYIGYGGDVCFLSTPLDIGVAFVLPVSIVIVTNAFFFGRVVHAIRKMSKIEKHSNRANTNHSIIFIKMSIFLGFTWIVGFLANMVNNDIMWYTFAVLNAGIGVLIFLRHVYQKCRSTDFKWKTETLTLTINSNHESKKESTKNP